jgi:hypothetical protein
MDGNLHHEVVVGFDGYVDVVEFPDNGAPRIMVTDPNGFESLEAGTGFNITWTAVDTIGVDHVDIEYSTNSGGLWQPVSSGEANDGIYPWLVPPTSFSLCFVKITAYDAAGNSDDDTSDDLFEIFLPAESTIEPADTVEAVDTADGVDAPDVPDVVDDDASSPADVPDRADLLDDSPDLADLADVLDLADLLDDSADLADLFDDSPDLEDGGDPLVDSVLDSAAEPDDDVAPDMMDAADTSGDTAAPDTGEDPAGDTTTPPDADMDVIGDTGEADPEDEPGGKMTSGCGCRIID